jgi:hypothetical protein
MFDVRLHEARLSEAAAPQPPNAHPSSQPTESENLPKLRKKNEKIPKMIQKDAKNDTSGTRTHMSNACKSLA